MLYVAHRPSSSDRSTWKWSGPGAVLSLWRSIKQGMWEELCRRVDPETLPSPRHRLAEPQRRSISGIAAAVGTCRKTVRLVLQGRRLRNESLRARIAEALRQGGHQPAPTDPPRRPSTKAIARSLGVNQWSVDVVHKGRRTPPRDLERHRRIVDALERAGYQLATSPGA